jgi:hypothetical protein
MKNLFIATLLLFSIMIDFSCKPENDCIAGSGGNLTIVATIKHHSKAILSQPNYRDTVYVKYNTQDNPGTNPNSYDATFIGAEGTAVVNLTGLKCGDYYIYAVGLDTSIALRVKGGIPFNTTQQSGTINLDIPVTEDH